MKRAPGKVWDASHEAARQAMLSAEASLRNEMRKTLAACRARHARVGDDEVRATRVAADLLYQLPGVILIGRLKAKQASALHLAKQLAVATRLGVRGLPLPLPAIMTAEDERRARAAARSFAAGWLKRALDSIDARGD